MKKTFKEFYSSIGLNIFPFNTFTSEQETDILKHIFVTQGEYDPIIDAFKSENNIIIIGERGSGKTAILEDFQRLITKRNQLATNIHDYSTLQQHPSTAEIYRLIISNSLIDLFARIGKNSLKLRHLNREEKLLLSYLLYEFLPSVSQDNLKDKISDIQVPPYVKGLNWAYNKIRGPLNFSATVGQNLAYQYLLKHFSHLPPIENESQIQEFFPELKLNVDDNFFSQDVSFRLLKKAGNIAIKLKFGKPVVFLDRLDEDPRFENDAEVISEFLAPFLTDNNLLSITDFQLIFFVWSTPFRFISDRVRTQKYYCPSLNWSKDDLEKLLNRRLEYYSHSRIGNYKDLFDNTVDDDDYQQIFDLANSNPRDLIHIFKIIFEEQYRVDSNATKFNNTLLKIALTKYVSTFNYYEYYPRKSNARANTMDIYSYAAYLLKLDRFEFSKNQLREQAGTGSSTNHYVFNMEKIGLIENIRQDRGNAVYRIKDPKIIFCQQNNLDLK